MKAGRNGAAHSGGPRGADARDTVTAAGFRRAGMSRLDDGETRHRYKHPDGRRIAIFVDGNDTVTEFMGYELPGAGA